MPVDGVSDGHGSGLRKVLNVKDLTFMGIAAIVGAGIFSTIGTASYDGGPGISLLFVLTAITCGFSAMCYAEFASRVPIAGSAYTYAYVSFGEIVAWIIGWALILEYAIGNIVVAISWSGYFNNLLLGFNIHLPGWLITDPGTAKDAFLAATKTLAADAEPRRGGQSAAAGGDPYLDLGANCIRRHACAPEPARLLYRLYHLLYHLYRYPGK